MVFTTGSTVKTAQVGLRVRISDSGTPGADFSLLGVLFEVWSSSGGGGSNKITEIMAPVNANGDAGALVTLVTGTSTAATYEVRAYLLQGTCNVGANEISGQMVTVDFGSTTRRAVGDGWIKSAYSDNGKGTFGFVVGYTGKSKSTLEGHSIFMLHRVKEGQSYYNWKVKDTSWSNADRKSTRLNSSYT